jgi:hypothetical protein
MSYTLRWVLGGPDVFKIENIYLKSNDNNITSTAMTGRSSFYPIFSSPPATTITLKRCTGLGRDAIENLRSYTHIPFPPFYIVEEGKKSAIGVGQDRGSAITTRLSKLNLFFQGVSTTRPEYDIEIVTNKNLQYIVQPQVKCDNLEFTFSVVEKPKKSKYIEVSNGERSIIISRRKNGAKRV